MGASKSQSGQRRFYPRLWQFHDIDGAFVTTMVVVPAQFADYSVTVPDIGWNQVMNIACRGASFESTHFKVKVAADNPRLPF